MENLIYAKETFESGETVYWIVDVEYFESSGCIRDSDFNFETIPDEFCALMDSCWEYEEDDAEKAKIALSKAGIKHSKKLQQFIDD